MNDTEMQLMINGIQQLQKGQDRIIELQAQTNDRLDHLDDCVDQCKAQVAKLQDQLMSAFPGGDTVGHRSYHEGVMQFKSRYQNLKHGLLAKLLEWGMIGTAGWLLLTLWGEFKIVVAQ